jgi:hypothetical protein
LLALRAGAGSCTVNVETVHINYDLGTAVRGHYD